MGAHYTYAGQLHNSVIVIIRHAEKPADGDGLAPAGDARANAYVDYFKNFTLGSKPIHFDYSRTFCRWSTEPIIVCASK